MNNRAIITLSLLAAGLSVSALSMAASDGPRHADMGDQAVFKHLDVDDDGRLTAAEMTKLPGVMARQRLDRMDGNHDGRIDRHEFEAAAMARADRMFARMDRNDDGSIAVDELNPSVSRDAGHGSSDHAGHNAHDDDRHHHDRHHGNYGNHGRPSTDERFAHMDTDNDGYVSAAEWQQTARQWHHRHGSHHAGPTDEHAAD